MNLLYFIYIQIVHSIAILQTENERTEEKLGDINSNLVSRAGCKEVWESWMLMKGDPKKAPNPVECCNDFGLTCGNSGVTVVKWRGQNLAGNVPPQIIENIEYVDLSDNELSGWSYSHYSGNCYSRFPSYFLASKNSIEYFPNFCTGFPRNSPPTLIDLSKNQITGSLNESIITHFEYVELLNNNITGALSCPKQESYPWYPPSCPKLKWLSLQNNKISTIHNLFSFSALEYLDLRRNQISSHFLNPANVSIPGFRYLKECYLGEQNPGGICVDDSNVVPSACGTIPKCPEAEVPPWKPCRKGIDRCILGYTCCVGLDDAASGSTTCRWKGAVGQAHGCIQEDLDSIN